jgi:hypothetical protein
MGRLTSYCWDRTFWYFSIHAFGMVAATTAGSQSQTWRSGKKRYLETAQEMSK